jgi:hypothetical protein
MSAATRIDHLANMSAGDSVKGTYYGVQFTGTVRSIRAHTMRHDVVGIDVELATPIMVNETERNGIHLWLGWDGTENPTFSGANGGNRVEAA